MYLRIFVAHFSACDVRPVFCLLVVVLVDVVGPSPLSSAPVAPCTIRSISFEASSLSHPSHFGSEPDPFRVRLEDLSGLHVQTDPIPHRGFGNPQDDEAARHRIQTPCIVQQPRSCSEGVEKGEEEAWKEKDPFQKKSGRKMAHGANPTDVEAVVDSKYRRARTRADWRGSAWNDARDGLES